MLVFKLNITTSAFTNNDCHIVVAMHSALIEHRHTGTPAHGYRATILSRYIQNTHVLRHLYSFGTIWMMFHHHGTLLLLLLLVWFSFWFCPHNKATARDIVMDNNVRLCIVSFGHTDRHHSGSLQSSTILYMVLC